MGTSTQSPIRVAACVGLVVAVGACATANTPQQDLAYERWAKCGTGFVQLDRVDLDGRILFTYTDSSGRQTVLGCLAEAGRTGPPLPEPRGNRPPGGP
jgi:hypothetical protein